MLAILMAKEIANMNSIFQTLIKDHEVQRELLDKLVQTSGDSAERRTWFSTLKKELKVHAKYEERFLYNPLIKENITQQQARHSVAEHKDIDDMIEDLESTSFSSPQWLRKMKKLKHCVEHHLTEEEEEVFPIAGVVLNSQQKTHLAKKYRNQVAQSFAEDSRA